ncbi:hypothetical protein [Arthrobacter sp. S39]|uniref:hypothetical protein n=1 Tax=Arthrobacter sp. S39 TaxID=2509720 RepID=UPI00103782AF|nr:hypothetical protein [Arthrobacter sp. S39]TAP45198.1 hypothetical protein EYS21_00155 [Arthrobacter sp. S39]
MTEVKLTLTVDELEVLWGTIRETLEAVDDREFSTRVGVERSELRRMQAELAKLMNTIPYLPD